MRPQHLGRPQVLSPKSEKTSTVSGWAQFGMVWNVQQLKALELGISIHFGLQVLHLLPGRRCTCKAQVCKGAFSGRRQWGGVSIWSFKRCFNIQGIVINPVVRAHMDVSENSGTPKSSILIGFSIIKHPFRGASIFGNTHIPIQYTEFRPWHYYWNVGNPQNLKMPHAQGSEACPNMRCDEADDTSNINDRNPACLVQLHYCRK